MDIYLLILMAFAFTGGLLLGCGNYARLGGAIIPGLVAGLLISGQLLSEHEWLASALLVASALVGSIASVYLPAENRVKRFCREQSSLVIEAGSYKLGRR
jgi:hypothetical protein